MSPFYGWGSTASSYYEEAVYFLPLSSQKFLYSFDQPQAESTSELTNMVLDTGPLDWESSTLTTRSLL